MCQQTVILKCIQLHCNSSLFRTDDSKKGIESHIFYRGLHRDLVSRLCVKVSKSTMTMQAEADLTIVPVQGIY
jgi:hypothetical protein